MIKLELVKDKDEEKFEFMYHGFLIGGNLVKEKGLKVLRRELAILDKLESISERCECGKKILDEDDRVLTGGEVEFNEDEFNLLYSYIGSVPWSTGKSVRNALATLDWMKQCYEDNPIQGKR